MHNLTLKLPLNNEITSRNWWMSIITNGHFIMTAECQLCLQKKREVIFSTQQPKWPLLVCRQREYQNIKNKPCHLSNVRWTSFFYLWYNKYSSQPWCHFGLNGCIFTLCSIVVKMKLSRPELVKLKNNANTTLLSYVYTDASSIT